MWLLDLVVIYPVFIQGLLRFLRWRDGGWRIEAIDKDGDGRTSWKEWW